MENPLSQFRNFPANDHKGQDGRHPLPGKRSDPGFSGLKGMRKSTRYGILLYLLFNPEGFGLSEEQRLWIIYYSRKFSDAELLRAAEISKKLQLDSLFFRRMKNEIQETHVRVPRLTPLKLKEERRIGIGYRDKGALRPLHRDHRAKEGAYWDEDILYLLPLTYEAQGKWITADEVLSLTGVNLLNEVLYQIERQTQSARPLLSKYSRTSR